MKRAAFRKIDHNAPKQNCSGLSRRQLQNALKDRGLRATGSTKELQKRLDEADAPASKDKIDPNNNNNVSTTCNKENRKRKRAPRSPLKKDIENELRALGAKLEGSKDDLKNRLLCWKKFDLGRSLIDSYVVPSVTQDDFPDEDFFRPLSTIPRSEVKLLTFEVITEWYLARSALNSRDKGRKLCLNRYCKNIGAASVDPRKLDFKCECASACSKKSEYVVYVSIGFFNNVYQILQATCQCVAGAGLSAACKHVAALCFSIEHFSCCGEVMQLTACTSKLQQWHKPPEPGRNLVPATVSQLLNESLPQFPANPKSTDDFLNILTSMSCRSSILHIRAVNPFAYFHDYSSLTSVPLQLQIMQEINSVSVSDVIRLEKLTQKQSASELWFETRKTRLTASIAGDIVRTVRNGNFSTCYARNQIQPKDLSHVPAIKWGKRHEQDAIKLYEKVTQMKVKKTGLFVDKMSPFLAATPDGKVFDDVLIKVKCPWVARNKKTTDAPFLVAQNRGGLILYSLKRGHKYFMQCQMQMHVTGAKYLDFVVWTTRGIFIESIAYDPIFCNRAVLDLEKYYKKVFCDVYLKLMWTSQSPTKVTLNNGS